MVFKQFHPHKIYDFKDDWNPFILKILELGLPVVIDFVK